MKLAYYEESNDAANYANPLFVTRYPDGSTMSTMQESVARKAVNEFNRNQVDGVPEQMTPTRACEIIKAEMDALKREKPNLPACQMKRLGLRFDWNIVYEALQP